MTVREFFKIMKEKNASDLYLRLGGVPRLRIDGRIRPLDTELLKKQDMDKIVEELLTTLSLIHI